jgi:hypothetical protein
MPCLGWSDVKLLLPSILAVAACSPTTYAYKFQLAEPGAHVAVVPGERDSLEDDTVKAEIQIADDRILLDLTNKTTEVLQVEWGKIALDRGDGVKTTLRPEVDLGWIDPGGTLAAQLVPFALPHTGTDAARYEGRRLELTVPVVAMREAKTYRFHFVAHVHSL